MMADIKKKIKLTEFAKITSVRVTEDKGVHLEWTAVKHAEKYVIKRSTSPEGEFAVINNTAELSLTDTTAEPNILYWYKVVAWRWLDAKKSSTTESAIQPATVSDTPPVNNLKTEEKDRKIFLSWDKGGYDRFIIYKTCDYFTKIMSITETTECSFCDESPVSGQAYYYAVQAVKTDGENELYSSISEKVGGVFLDQTEIRSIKKIIGKKALINVRVIAGADGYIFERCDKKNGEFTEVGRTKDITEVNFEDKPPHRGSYSYRVCAYKNVGGKEFKGSYSEIKHL